MSAWRAKAIEMFPELKRDVEESKRAGELWFSLFSVFKHGIMTEDYDTSLLVSEYADWCITNTSALDVSGPHQATLMGFYESIAYDKGIWHQLSKALPKRQFLQNIGTFKYCLSDSEIEHMKQCFNEA
jgi:hypothetical protein